jgi:tetratricopeptide (TPR) repeat protein
LEREARLGEAKARLSMAPGDVEAVIWVGRRTAYLGRYREAIDIFTEAISRHPDDPRLYRHRGHRYITIRRFPDAVRDLTRAANLIEGRPDEVEPDGLPNAAGIPTGTLQFNIWYHLGLGHYLLGEFDQAAEAWRAGMRVSTNPDTLCATSYWLTMTLRRSGRAEEARQLLEPIHAGMELLENHDYHRLLLAAKGEIEPQVVLEATRSAEDGIAPATVGYGLARLYLDAGKESEGRALLERTAAGATWAAFGRIAAEADLARLRPTR